MFQKSGIYFRESFEDIGLSHQNFALFDKGPDDKNAHSCGFGTFQNIRCHESAMFGKGKRGVFAVLTPTTFL